MGMKRVIHFLISSSVAGTRFLFRLFQSRRRIIFTILTLGLLFGFASTKYFKENVTTIIPDKAPTNQSIDIYSVNTPVCKIPNVQRANAGAKPQLKKGPSCRKAKQVATMKDDDQVVLLGERFMNNKYNCTVSEIFPSSNGFTFSKPERIYDSVDVSEKELIVTRCGKYYNLDANFPLNAELQQKLDRWDSLDEIPFSVLFLGFSSFSRAKFHQDVPKSVRSMLDLMDFIEFQGYHSIAPFPLENFLGFLGGAQRSTLQKTCWSNWTSPIDDCSFIWKDFAGNDYVTMYMEDGDETFRWDHLGGFHKKPTDFFTHPLFQSRTQLRKESPIKGLSALCLSQSNPQAFLYEYAQRFYKKFMDYPFFGFVWSGYAPHAKSRFTSGTDDGFSKLLYVLRYFPEALERTLVIVTSDRGSQGEGPGKFMEKSMPGLFIRVPEVFERKFPTLQIKKVMQANSKRLVTPFDIHHTLKHALVLNGMSLSTEPSGDSENFEPILKDRSSLLVPISETRTCDDVHIPSSICTCNSSSEIPAWDNPLSKILMADFAINELNNLINSEAQKVKCVEYFPAKSPVISTEVQSKGPDFTDGLLTFRAEPEGRAFKVSIRVIHTASNLDKFERLSSFSRVSGDKSWCPGADGVEDEIIKHLCTC